MNSDGVMSSLSGVPSSSVKQQHNDAAELTLPAASAEMGNAQGGGELRNVSNDVFQGIRGLTFTTAEKRGTNATENLVRELEASEEVFSAMTRPLHGKPEHGRDTKKSDDLPYRAIESALQKAKSLVVENNDRVKGLTNLKELLEQARGLDFLSQSPSSTLPKHEVDDVWRLEVEKKKSIEWLFDQYRLEDDIETAEKEQVGKGAILRIVRKFNNKAEYLKTYIVLRSKALISALRSVVQTREEREILAAEEVTMDEPCWVFFHNKSRLQTYIQTLPEGEEKQHVEFFINFMDQRFPLASETLESFERRRDIVIDDRLIWVLYAPGSTVFQQQGGEWQAYQVASLSGFERRDEESWSPLEMTLRSYACVTKDKRLNPVLFRYIFPFTTQKSMHVRDLKFIPSGYIENEDEIRQQMSERGARYWTLRQNPTLQEYSGDAWAKSEKAGPLRVMVDIEDGISRAQGQALYNEQAAEAHMRLYTLNMRRERTSKNEVKAPEAYIPTDTESREPVTDMDQILLYCPRTVDAFSLTKKSMRSVNISELTDVAFLQDPFRRVVLSRAHRNLVTSMISAHVNQKVGIRDFIKGKGRGLVILLHGPPGVGKTLTAECVAEQQKKPLYMITCGDLGLQPQVLETTLRSAFHFADRWNAVLLLDEADVFLQERDIRQLERNALVSVFLRELEYFDGVMILTTNRPGLLDEAFQSRIHLTLSLPSLNLAQQKKVWFEFLRESTKDNDTLGTTLEWIENFTEKDNLNGRQIRNHVMTAAALASHDASSNGKITKKHLEDVITTAREFSSYMKRVTSEEPETLARQRGYRAIS